MYVGINFICKGYTMKFENLRAADYAAEEKYRLERITYVSADNTGKNSCLYLSNTMKKKFNTGEISVLQAQYKAISAINREFIKTVRKHIERIEFVENAGILDRVEILVEWKKSRTWGMNPSTTIRVYVDGQAWPEGVYYGYASGCGYDKLSASVSEALNQSPAIMRVLYEKADTLSEHSNDIYRHEIGYGCGYNVLPSFEGGVGISCFQSIFENLGYIWRTGISSNSVDTFTIQKEGEK